jgi:hypothetical protein
MAVYRFKVYIEDNEDVFRDIDILASQSFEHFHNVIQEAFKFDAKHAAAFFVSDDYWRKGQEITLRKEDLPLEEEEIRKKVEPKKLMAETRIAKYIEQPHQRFVYVFDPVAQWNFFIEMIKIVEENPKTKYPFIVKSIGAAPKQYKQVIAPKDEPGLDVLVPGALLESEIEDDEIFKTMDTVVEGVEEDDLISLEGEEGEEPEDAEDEESADLNLDEEAEDV